MEGGTNVSKHPVLITFRHHRPLGVRQCQFFKFDNNDGAIMNCKLAGWFFSPELLVCIKCGPIEIGR